MSDSNLRTQIAFFFARFFCLHLNAELGKSDRLLNHITLEGIPYREVVYQMLQELEDQFPGVKPDAPYNLLERWVASRDVPPYQESTFRIYNRGYLARLIDLRDGNSASGEKMRERIRAMLSTGTFYGQGFTFRLFFHAENVMREEMRKALLNVAEIPFEKAYHIVSAQSETIASFGYDYYDEVLRNAVMRSDQLLKNILPDAVAEELKEKGRVEPVHLDSVSVIFTDFKGFTKIAEKLTPSELIKELDQCFSQFDAIIARYNLERIKTIGDAYMCAGGLPLPNHTHAVDAVLAALEIRSFMTKMSEIKSAQGLPFWELRIGIHTGPVVAGVIGEKKFAYDIWGDTVNTASRMESAGVPGTINISREVYDRVSHLFETQSRGEQSVKNKDPIPMYFVSGVRPHLLKNEVPGPEFHRLYNELKTQR